jgi:diguanylate cyclase (GGDEF)-like protein
MSKTLRILIVEDDAVDRKMIKRHLAATSLDVVTHETSSAEECLKILQVTLVDCILLDYRLPEMNGIDFLVKLRSAAKASGPAVVMLTGTGNERLAVQAMRQGVQDYLVKDEISPQSLEEAIRHAIEVSAREKQAEADSRRLEELAMIDPTTRIGNRNFFNMRLDHALSRAQRQKEPVCLLYMDLNGFKKVNDSHGHLAGDQLLKEIGRRLADTARDADTVARVGGDEFAVVMETGISAAGVTRLAERIHEALTRPIAIRDGIASVGVSIGIAQFPDCADSAEGLICAADMAMYSAKVNDSPFHVFSDQPPRRQARV